MCETVQLTGIGLSSSGEPDPDTPTFFFVHPIDSPSIPGSAIYADGSGPTRLAIHDMRGRLVRTLVNGWC